MNSISPPSPFSPSPSLPLKKDSLAKQWSRKLRQLERSALHGNESALLKRALATPNDLTWFYLAVKNLTAKNKKIRLTIHKIKYSKSSRKWIGIEEVHQINSVIGKMIEVVVSQFQLENGKDGIVRRNVIDLPQTQTMKSEQIPQWIESVVKQDAVVSTIAR